MELNLVVWGIENLPSIILPILLLFNVFEMPLLFSMCETPSGIVKTRDGFRKIITNTGKDFRVRKTYKSEV